MTLGSTPPPSSFASSVSARRSILSRTQFQGVLGNSLSSAEIELSFDETEEYQDPDTSSAPAAYKPNSVFNSMMNKMSSFRSTPSMKRRTRMPSMNRSCDSTDSSSSGHGSTELTAKTTYRILVLGASQTGKTSIVRQFLYDQFSPKHQETMDDMYRGEFEDAQGRTVNFDIQDVGGCFVYEFPAMRSVSLASADAFILVFSLDNAESWEEASKLRDMVREAKDPEVPIVVVANKSDLQVDSDLPYESLEATAIFDWENGYVESSAKERLNINKIFKELLNQAKNRFDVSIPTQTPSRNLNPTKISQKINQDCLRRRQSLPAAPAGMPMLLPKANQSKISEEEEDVFMCKSPKPKSRFASPARRSSLAALRRDSCKIS